MNRTPSSHPSPPVGEKVPGGRLRGIPTGSWPQLTSNFWRCSLSMDLVAADVRRVWLNSAFRTPHSAFEK